MSIGNLIGRRILDLCDREHISLNKLSMICGITQSTLNNVVNGGSRNPTISTIKKVCDGLKISLADFFDTEYFDHSEQELR